jgi:hypothetical protein
MGESAAILAGMFRLLSPSEASLAQLEDLTMLRPTAQQVTVLGRLVPLTYISLRRLAQALVLAQAHGP